MARNNALLWFLIAYSGAGTGFAQLEQDCPGDSLYYALMREKAAKGLAVASTEELFDE